MRQAGSGDVDHLSYSINVQLKAPFVSSKLMSGLDQGQNRAVGRSQENASTIESTAATVSTFLQGVARLLLPERETGVPSALSKPSHSQESLEVFWRGWHWCCEIDIHIVVLARCGIWHLAVKSAYAFHPAIAPEKTLDLKLLARTVVITEGTVL